ncbi:MAG: hypothetical protein Q8R60_05080 [Mycobacteriales bacterium]|nr:hypothetical protein [Mycobacteriales bacterium]
MSEFPFADQADSVEESGDDKKKLLLVGGVAAAVLLGGGAFFLTSGGDAEEEAFFVPKRPAKVAPAAAPKTPAKLPVVFAAPVGRDPFRALYTAPTGGGAAAPAGGTTTTPVTTTPTTAPTTGGSTVVITPTTQPTSSTPTQTASQSTIRLKAYDINTKVGTFVLDGKTTVTGKVNDVLAKKVLIIAIRPDREPGTFFATLKVGDGANFDAHFGQTVVIP